MILVSVACTKVDETIEAIKKSQARMPLEAILFTHEERQGDTFRVINIPKLDYKQYNEFVALKLGDYVDSDVLLVQNDGYILDGTKWNDEFLEYDYVGAPWPPQTHFKDGEEIRVGNGGFSYRSKNLLDAPKILGLEFTDKETGYWHEDGFLCVHYRDALEAYGIKFAPVEVAARFSRELEVPETVKETFGFHKYL